MAGIAGGVSWLLLQSLFAADWGDPGTQSYSKYEFFNRMWSLPLILMGVGFVAVDAFQRQPSPQLSRLPIVVILVGFAAMIAGNLAEFWLFTDYPYGEMNARSFAWIAFLLGMLIELIGLALLGRVTLRAGILPKWSGILLLCALPLELIASYTVQMILLVTAVEVVILSAWILWQRRAAKPT